RAVQKLLENLTESYQITLAIAALRPGAARLASDPNGHHVIQYCLIHFPDDVIEPILKEIADKCYEVATDRSGCCVLQACIEHSHGQVRNRLVGKILRNAVILAEHPYGNYVLQHMLGLKAPEFTARLVRQLQGNFASLSCNKYASNVVEKCLNEAGEDLSAQIVMELITCSNPALLLIDPYANFVIQSALTVSTGYVYDCLLDLISDNMGSMRTNLYGKKILSWFEKRRILAI
ncbi:pumilio homolog 12-like, partial [Bidens hawaiensis]|uniref:pumilio homolog 12-like n=1 Tax=Bidens hawaiensis TaxID=980011 RepID=UPI00404BA30B